LDHIVALQMSSPHTEPLPDGSVRVTDTCGGCNSEVTWDHVAFTDVGKLLVGHCLCEGQRHSVSLGPRDRVVDGKGRKLG
jgi:hypothetical protein